MRWFNKVVFHNYANFKGRARRKEFWMFYLFYMLFISLATIADIVIFDLNLEDINDPEVVYPLQTIFMLAVFIPMLSVCARRLHDIGKSGWLQLIGLIPLIGAIVLIIFACRDSDPLENKYGTSPKLITPSTDVKNLKSSVDGVAESHQDSTPDQTNIFCGKCGKSNSRDNKFCTQCGQTLAS